MPKIAIIHIDTYWDSDDYLKKVADHITEWEDVSDEDYIILDQFIDRSQYAIVAQVEEQEDLIHKTIKEGIFAAKKAKEEAEKQKALREERKKKREEKKLKKEQEERLALFRKLQNEFST